MGRSPRRTQLHCILMPRARQSLNHVSLCKHSCDTLLVVGLSLQASEHAEECVSFIMKRGFNQLCITEAGRITSQQQDGQVFNSTMSMLGCQRASGLPTQDTSPGLAVIALARVTLNCPITPQRPCKQPLSVWPSAAEGEGSEAGGGHHAHDPHSWSPQGCSGLHPTCQTMLPGDTAERYVHSRAGLTLLWLIAERGDQCIQVHFSQY